MIKDYRLRIIENIKRLNFQRYAFVLKKADFNLANFKKIIRSKKFLVIFILTFYSAFWLLGFMFTDKQQKYQLTNLPYQEKVADGVWMLKNRDPIHQVLAQAPKADLTLNENKQISKDPNKQMFRWSVKNSNGTKFEFGAVNSNTPDGKVMPVVNILNKEGYFVKYQPSIKYQVDSIKYKENPSDTKYIIPNTVYNYVTPKVKGNVIEWEISKGVTARYTMMQDRVKEDIIVDKASSLQQLASSSISNKYQIEFNVQSGNIKDSKQALKGELMPGGDIDWFVQTAGETGPVQTQFTFPAPIVKDSSKHNEPGSLASKYEFKKISKANDLVSSASSASGDSEYSLAIVLDPNQVETATWPLTIDPVTLDAAVGVNATAYGNGRNIVRDSWGNLIAVFTGDTIQAGTSDDVWFKPYNLSAWQDAGIELTPNSPIAEEARYIAIDIDSSGNVHLVYIDFNAIEDADLIYNKLTVTRDGTNAITSIAKNFTLLDLSQAAPNLPIKRPSIIIANKGGGAGVEKVVVSWGKNNTSVAQVLVMQCDVADTCTSGGKANWKDASEEKFGSVNACVDTDSAGDHGWPQSFPSICKGPASSVLFVGSTTNTHQVLTQIPGKPRRSPASVKKDSNSVFSDLTNTIDNNTGTTDAVNSLTTTDYIYVGDDKPFSKVSFDITNTNSNAQLFTTKEYWNGASWTTLSNTVDNTSTATIAFSEDGSIFFDEPSNWATTSVNSVTKYWVRFRPAGAFDASVSIAEIYVNDRNSKALMVVGGSASTLDLGASYIVWDEINNDRWENNPASVAIPWRENLTAVDGNGSSWTTYTNYPLTAAVDYKNNAVYLAYVEDIATDVLHVKKIANNKDVTVAANWDDTGFPTVTEGTDLVASLTSDGADIYLFYVLDVATNSLVFRRCSPGGGGNGNTCDNASDWGSEKTLSNSTDVSHPQAVVTKVTGDTVAIDTIYTMPTALDVVYERHYVDLADKTVVVAASGDDAFERNCVSGTDDQDITATTVKLGRDDADASCVGSVDSLNHAGLRFPNITVAQGAVVSSAYIDVRVTTRTGSTVVPFTIYGEDADNSSSFTAFTDCTDPCSNGVNTRTKTTSSTSQSINFVTNTYRIDVTKQVQEIVCRGAANTQPCVGDYNGAGTWASGNALTLLMIASEADTGADNYMTAISQDDATTTMLDPTLQINVAPSGTTGKSYSMGSAVQLATGSGTLSVANLDHPLSSSEFGAVASDDTNYASISATTNYASQSAQPAFMFKVNNSDNNNTDKIDATAIVKSTVPTSSKPVYLQIYRGGGTNNWVTVASNNNTAADTDITLTPGQISTNLSEYYFNETPGIGSQYAACTTGTANCWAYWRVYQDTPGTNFNAVLAVDYFAGTFSGGASGPDKVAFSNAARTLTVGACNGAASVFTMELQNGTTPTNPLATTVVRVSSNSTDYTIYSDDTCATPVTDGDFTYTTSQNTKSVYIIDNKKSITTRTLTGTRQSGDTLTTGTQDYTVNVGAVSKLVITLPGQTFTDGTGNSGTVTNQLSGIRFPMQINATDANYNVNTAYTGDKVLVFSGPGVGSATPTVLDKNNAPVNYGSNTTITFSSGTAAVVQTTLYKGESTTITATDGGSYGNASATLTIDVPNTKIRGGSTIRGGSKIQ